VTKVLAGVALQAACGGSAGSSGGNCASRRSRGAGAAIVGSLGAKARKVQDRQPVNAPKLSGQVALDAAWVNVERNFRRAPVKDGALALLRRFQERS